MKFYKSVLAVLLLTLLSTGCDAKKSDSQSITSQNEPAAVTSASNSAQTSLDKFVSSIESLNKTVSQNSKEPIDLAEFHKNLTELKKNQDNINGIEPILKYKTLDTLGKINFLPAFGSSSQEAQIADLQNSLKADGEELDLSQGQGTFGSNTSKALNDFLEIKLLPKVRAARLEDPSLALQGQKNLVDLPQPNSSLSPLAIAALVVSSLSLGANGFLFLLLRNSSIRIKRLEEKRREDKDELNKLSVNADRNIKTLAAQQSEIDRKLQQQRQQAKAANYSNPPQPYGGSDQIEFGSNMPPAQSPSPFLTSERSAYAAESPKRDYQSPKSAHEAIAQQYNTNPNAIASSAQGVSETEDSIYRRRRDSSIREVTLQNVSNHSYWVITDGEGGYWLTPIADLKLNPMNFDTFQALFQSNGEPPSGRLQLIKPAKVSQAATNQWELLEQGEVQFF